MILPFFSPKNNIFHIELPLLSPFDEELPTESKMVSTLEIDQKWLQNTFFCVFIPFDQVAQFITYKLFF